MSTSTLPSKETSEDMEPPPKRAKNAFTEIMLPKPPAPRPGKRSTTTTSATKKPLGRRDGLFEYIQTPQSFPKSRVIYYNDDWVLIRDLYPKASVHLLLLPRKAEYYSQHPLDAFQNAQFLASAKKELVKAVEVAASELRRLYSKDSATEQARNEAMVADEPPLELPPGRDWSAGMKTGIHGNPSMNHLHIHIVSQEFRSECMKHRKHYNSFNTRFLVPLEDMPLERGDDRWGAGRYLEADLVCWRCGENFGKKFARLKEHLEEEFEVWKKL